jgi:hypothetical protein
MLSVTTREWVWVHYGLHWLDSHAGKGVVAILETWTLRFLHAVRIARQRRRQDECCSGVE